MNQGKMPVWKRSAWTAPVSRHTRQAQAPKEGEEDSQRGEKNAAQKNQCIGAGQSGRSTRIHAPVDAVGNPNGKSFAVPLPVMISRPAVFRPLPARPVSLMETELPGDGNRSQTRPL